MVCGWSSNLIVLVCERQSAWMRVERRISRLALSRRLTRGLGDLYRLSVTLLRDSDQGDLEGEGRKKGVKW